MRLTHLGGPTVLVEVDGWRILTDPTFDPPGRRYAFGWGTSSRKTAGPALAADEVGPVDVVLLSHDHHADNLDDAGRTALASAGVVVTTAAGARRLGNGALGLRAGEETVLSEPGKSSLTVRATPCRHGPPLSRPIVGPVVGFALRLGDQRRTALWMTGDTVLHGPLRRTADELDVDVALVHLGLVRFPITGPLRYSMDGKDAVELIAALEPRVAAPVHYEGWSHFSEPPAHLREAIAAAPPAVRERVVWLEPGAAREV
ncbi:MBL fold metallo-hydrolase [Mumia zhuanghuii]|uniref:MBL fold metallo-hydrolase n=2 Tax=Mumia TaxID=1546255 RepID=A0ABW1QIK1_9ACTN|nr:MULTISPECIES: MBL fold metallo-hydrolase [Mumia]KAA1424772.1 MBL fold metallo-hydrolase [Mumia zhuanghuii]